PPADLAIEKTGADFLVEQANLLAGGSDSDAPRGEGLDRATLHAGAKGLRASVSFDAKEAGLYTVSVLGAPGGGQRWTADACRKAVVCPGQGSSWRPVLSQVFGTGRHTLAVALVDGASVERVKIERKKSAPADYVGTLRRIGYDPGPDGSVSRDRALGAAGFVREHHRDVQARSCGDVSVPEQNLLAMNGANVNTAGTGTSSAETGSSGTTASSTVAPPQLTPLEPALRPPQDPASPTTPGTTAGTTP